MSLIAIFISSIVCLMLHFLSRNIFIFIVGLAGVFSSIALCQYLEKGQKPLYIISMVINAVLCLISIGWHLFFGDFINDYIIMSALLMLYDVLMLIEMAPFGKQIEE